MKLSELSTDKALDVLCELTPYASSIMEDEQILSALDGFTSQSVAERPKSGDREDGENRDGNGNANASTAGIRMLAGMVKNIPLLLKTHRADVYSILSIMNECSVEEIAGQPVRDTIRQVREIFQDPELLTFFKSSARREQTEPSAPSADSPA